MSEKAKTGLFSVLKGLVVEEVVVPDKVAPPKVPPTGAPGASWTASLPHPAANGGIQAFAAPPTATAYVPADPEAQRALETRLRAAMPPAYKAFLEQHDALSGVVTDDTQRFQAALKTSHTSPDQLLEALDALTDILRTASTDFEHDNAERKNKATAESKKSVEATDALIASNESQLQAIQHAIATLREKRDAAAQAASGEIAHLETVRMGFAGAIATLSAQLETQRTSIATMTRKG